MNSRRINLVELGTILAPVVLVKLIAWQGAGPASAPAAALQPAAVDPAPAAPQTNLTPDQRAALDWIASRPRAVRDLACPMLTQAPAAPVEPEPEPAPVEQPQGPSPLELAQSALRELSISALIGSDRRAVAVIDATPRRVGEELLPGWFIAEIDARRRTVRVLGPDAAEVILSADPEPRRDD